ncbi:MAG: hypothetical protein IKT98_06295 [Selenomonadaceae bacterium]|nr:hypothetical protein [Selenomonadaceae bacterium]
MIKGSINSNAGSIALSSNAGMNYNQAEALKTQFHEFFAGFKKQFKDGWTNVKNTFSKYESQITKELDALSKAKDPEAYMTALKTLNAKVADTKSTGFDAAVQALDKGNEIKTSFESMIPVLTSFLHPANYSNYYVRAAFDENKTAGDISASELSGAGSFSINSMPNNSRIILAENSALTANNGAVVIDSKAENRVVAITGMGGEYGTSSKAANRGAGISVKVGNFTDNSVVAVGKNAQINASNIRKSFGAAINVMNNGVNNAVLLGDNGLGTRNQGVGTSLEDKADAKILNLTNKTLDILGDYGKLLGSSSIDDTGEINAVKFYLLSKKTGTLNSIAVAGTENSETHGFFDGYNKYGKYFGDGIQGGEMALGLAPSLLSKYLGTKIQNKLFHSGEDNPEQAVDDAANQAGNEDGGVDVGVDNNMATSQLNIAGAGSVAVNLNSGETGYHSRRKTPSFSYGDIRRI